MNAVPVVPSTPQTIFAAAEGSEPAGRSPARQQANAASATESPKGSTEFDPIKENGRIFVDWKNPRLAIVITGREDGYMEPCGCAGLNRMKGGMARRYTMFEELRKGRGWPVVALDVGGIVKGFDRQAVLKFYITVDAMQTMRYDVIGLGAAELRLPTNELFSVLPGVPGKPSPFVSANLGVFGFDTGVPGRKRVIETAGLKLGVTSVLGKKAQDTINNNEIQKKDAADSLREILPSLKQERCNLLVLLAHATMEETVELATQFPEFDLVVTAGGPAEPPPGISRVIGKKTRLIEVGEKGMFAMVLGLFESEDRSGMLQLKCQRVPLDSRFQASELMVKQMAAYQDQVKGEGLIAKIVARAMPESRSATMGEFIGSQRCASCHEKAFGAWKKTGHARAYKTLETISKPARNYDPECVSCHVVGWHPTQHFSYKGGFASPEKTPDLASVGCEACHGPGSAHAAAEIGADAAKQQKLRRAIAVSKTDAEKHLCLSCHDGDNSPDFQFKTYWPKVDHPDK